MTLFDYIVIFILVCSTLIGLMRGLLKEILSLAGWVIAFLVANAYGVTVAQWLPFHEQSLRLITAFVGLFIGTRLLASLLITALDGVMSVTGLKLMDRSLGGLFGLARGGIIIFALMIVGGMTHLHEQPFWRHALLRPALEKTALKLKVYLPGDIARYVRF